MYDSEKTGALKKALRDYHLDEARALIKTNADPRTLVLGESALHRAAFKNHIKLCKTCLKKGFNPNFQEKYVGWTPLMRTSSSAIVALLISSKADVQQQNAEKRTALHFYAYDSNVTTGETISLLHSAGANPDVQDANGDTPLHRACKDPSGFFSMKVAALVVAGCNRTLKNLFDRTARQDLEKFNPTKTAHFDATVAAASEVNATRQDFISKHLPIVFAPVIIAYVGWSPELEADIEKTMKKYL